MVNMLAEITVSKNSALAVRFRKHFPAYSNLLTGNVLWPAMDDVLYRTHFLIGSKRTTNE